MTCPAAAAWSARAWAVSLKGLAEPESLALIRSQGKRLGLAALERAADGRTGVGSPNRPATPGWPAMATDVARLRRGRLSVLSPFEFLPANGEDARRWLDLLPAIRLVDAVSWRRPRRLRGCGPEELAALYRLTWAVRRARSL